MDWFCYILCIYVCNFEYFYNLLFVHFFSLTSTNIIEFTSNFIHIIVILGFIEILYWNIKCSTFLLHTRYNILDFVKFFVVLQLLKNISGKNNSIVLIQCNAKYFCHLYGRDTNGLILRDHQGTKKIREQNKYREKYELQ